jgi:hypothetical protein
MILKELLALTALKEAKTYRVSKGTLEKKPWVPGSEGEDPSMPWYDWRNPNHNPSGKKPEGEKPHKVTGKYNKDNYPVLDSEFDTRIFDPELVKLLKADYGREWNKMSELEQIKAQIEHITDMRNPMFDRDMKKYDDYVNKRAAKLQKEIKR